MHASQVLPRLVAALLALASALALAQPQKPYQPAVGQGGKDVVWVPTSDALVETMLDMAKVTPSDFVLDLGSGDGRTVIAAAKRGAHALGIEYNPDMVELSRFNAKQAGVTDRAAFVKADLFQTDFSKATVITMFLLPDINVRLRPKLLAMKPGTRVVSNTFTMAEWQADETVKLDGDTGCDSWCTALLWIVPAQVAGRYSLPQGELELKQEFQMLSGTLATGGKTFVLAGGRVRGEELSFLAGGRRYQGRMSGGKLELR